MFDTSRPQTRQAGFTLLELMIVIAVLAIVMAMALPSLLNARMAANEARAISNMRTIISVNEQYRVRFITYADTLANLADTAYIGTDYQSGGSSGGYLYAYVGTPTDYSLNLDPAVPGESARRYFFTDSSGVIRFSTTGTASSASPPVDG